MGSRFLVILLACIWVLFFVPNWLLSRPEIRKELNKQTSAALDANVTLKSATWVWYPLPHISFEEFHASGREFCLNASVLEAYPSWTDMLAGRFRIDGIALADPDFLLLSIPSKKKETRPPINWIKVTNGRFRVSAGLKFKALPLKNKKPHLTGIYGILEIDGDELKGRVSGKTGFAQQVSVNFAYNLTSLEFNLKSQVHHLDIARLYYKNITTHAQFPAEGFLDLGISARGKALEYLKGSLEAASKCLIAKTAKPGSLFSCGSLRLLFNYRPDDLSLDIKQLEFVQPEIKLTGKIRLNKPEGHQHLFVDLKGRDIDLQQVRKSVLSLFKGEELVRDVCNIVRGGRARRLSFRFDDDPRHLESLHCMLIKGDLEAVPVYVPDKHLFIDSVSGSMEIENALLRLENARVKLRNSFGSNGLFVYGVADGNHELELDIDLDADLKDVKWALGKFVNKKALNDQLEKINQIRGRARGRLMLGDDEHDFDTFVDVTSVQGQLFYQEFSWPVRIEGGKISYAYDTLKWKDLTGRAGKHKVDQLTGEFSWKGRDKVMIENFAGILDASSLLKEAAKCPALERIRDKFQLRASGILEVKELKAGFSLDEIKDARYSLSFKPENVEVEANLLPGPLRLKSGHFSLDEGSLAGRRCRGTLAGSEFYSALNLKHVRFQHWQGKLKFSGSANQKIGSWVETNGWVPSKYFPRLPVYLKNFQVELLGQDHQHVSGSLVWKKFKSKADIDIETADNMLNIKKISVAAGRHEGSFSMLLDQGRDKRFSLAWKGTVNKSLLDKCFRKNNLLAGSLSGNFSLDYSALDPNGFRWCRGHLHSSGLIWSWGVEKPIFLGSLVINAPEGTDGKVLLQTDFRIFQDLITVSGDISFLKHKIAAYLDLYGERLSDRSLRFFLGPEEQEGSQIKVDSSPPENTSPSSTFLSDWNIDMGGEISFDFDTIKLDLSTRLKMKGVSKKPRIVEVKGVNGFGKFEVGEFREVRIFAQNFCGLFLRGSVKIDENGEQQRALTVGTGKEMEVPFEEFLPCVGFRQKVLSGPFSAKMEVTSSDGISEAVGSLSLHARDGNISKFGLISRILGVVNLVDLFSDQPGIGLTEGGFPYDEIIVKSRIKKGVIGLEHAVIKGRGLNLYGTGNVDMRDGRLDLIVFVAPLKTVDKIITSVPIIGAIIGGKHRSLITIPVKVSGPWENPEVNTMPAKAVADVFHKVLFNVIKAPFSIFSRKDSKGQEKLKED